MPQRKGKRRSKRVPVPEWMDAHIRKCKQAFGLWDWALNVRIIRNLKREGDRCAGYHVTTYRTLTSTLEYAARLQDDDFGHEVVTHELLHVALIEPDRAVRAILDFVPEKYKDHCLYLYEEAKEHTIQKLALHLTPLIRTVQPGGSDERC
jgi:hypothetical protein